MNSGYIRAKEKIKVEDDGSSDEMEMAKSGDLSRRGRNSDFSVGQIQNSKAARVYVFGQIDVYENDDKDIEMSEIRSRKANRNNHTNSGSSASGNSTESDNIFFEKQISEEDTLLNIALQYGCSVSELKRINKLMSDQDYFALKKIKVPIKRYGLLTELLEQEKRNHASTSTSIDIPKSRVNGAASLERTDYVANDIAEESDSCLSDPEMQHLLIRTLSIRENINSQSKQAEDFLNSMDRDLKNIRQSTKSYKPSLQDVAHTLTGKRIQPLKKQTNLMMDCCYCSKRQIVGMVLCVVVVFVLILAYNIVLFIYGKTHSESEIP